MGDGVRWPGEGHDGGQRVPAALLYSEGAGIKINTAIRRILFSSLLVFAALGTQALAAPKPTAPEPIHFAGLQQVSQCFPGAMRPHERRPVFLRWKAAHGGATPRSRFVYAIFMARTPGGENFSQPSWTTEGHLTFETPKLPPNRYFVVRAQDRFGHQDHNRVELQARNPCV